MDMKVHVLVKDDKSRGWTKPQDDLHEAGQATEFSMVVPPLSAGSTTATGGVSAVIRRMEVRVWMAPHLLVGNVLLQGLVPDRGAVNCCWLSSSTPAEVLALMAAARSLMLAVRALLSFASSSLAKSCFLRFLLMSERWASIFVRRALSSRPLGFLGSALPSLSVTVTRWWFVIMSCLANGSVGWCHRIWAFN